MERKVYTKLRNLLTNYAHFSHGGTRPRAASISFDDRSYSRGKGKLYTDKCKQFDTELPKAKINNSPLETRTYSTSYRTLFTNSINRPFDSANSDDQSSIEINHGKRWLSVVGGFLLVGFGGFVTWKWLNTSHNQLLAAAIAPENPSEQVIPHLPEFKLAQVAEHYDVERRVWVTFNRGVYDVTNFVAKHPGGDRILMAAGGSLEPFWELYPTHQRPDVFEILERHRIGNLAAEDRVQLDSADTGHFKNEPKRHPAFLIRAAKPFNGETPPFLLTQKFFTPNELFYVRNHLPVPRVDAASYELDIEGLELPQGKTFTLAELKKFPRHGVSATIQCGGNRRSEMGIVKPVAGLAWSGGAIGNALWTGVRLKDVMKAAGFHPQKYKNPEKLHIQFEGMDSDQSGECYGSSIPFSYMLDDNFQPILAFEMNNRELPLDHGFPVRLILPGIVGARSVKWLNRIIISDEESQSPWQQRDYKVFSPSVTMETVDFSTAPAIQDTPVTSYICSHQTGQVIHQGLVTMEGYAFSGGGRQIVRVEISIDEGKTWKVANLVSDDAVENGTRNGAWALWSIELDFSQCRDEVDVWVKAVDSGYNQQAENFSSVYNYRGLLATAFHRIHLKVSK